jgi:hypothetical protein
MLRINTSEAFRVYKPIRIILAVASVAVAAGWCVFLRLVYGLAGGDRPATGIAEIIYGILGFLPLLIPAAVFVSVWLMQVRLFHAVAFLAIPCLLVSFLLTAVGPIAGIPLALYFGSWCFLYRRIGWQKQI